MDLKEAALLGETADEHWYYVSKGRALLRCLEGITVHSVLDVGAGSGVFARLLLRRTGAREATCVDPGYAADREERVGGKPLRFRRSVDRVDADLVLLMDVLEHVEDDVALLRHYRDLAPAGTHFLVTVPAGPWLFSGHDVFLGHFRRYRADQLRRVIRAAGLTEIRVRCFFALLFPMAAARRLLGRWRPGSPASDLRRHPAWVNRALVGLHALELTLLGVNRWLGLTVFALARRDGP